MREKKSTWQLPNDCYGRSPLGSPVDFVEFSLPMRFALKIVGKEHKFRIYT